MERNREHWKPVKRWQPSREREPGQRPQPETANNAEPSTGSERLRVAPTGSRFPASYNLNRKTANAGSVAYTITQPENGNHGSATGAGSFQGNPNQATRGCRGNRLGTLKTAKTLGNWRFPAILPKLPSRNKISATFSWKSSRSNWLSGFEIWARFSKPYLENILLDRRNFSVFKMTPTPSTFFSMLESGLETSPSNSLHETVR
jgi:hypothetical protein